MIQYIVVPGFSFCNMTLAVCSESRICTLDAGNTSSTEKSIYAWMKYYIYYIYIHKHLYVVCMHVYVYTNSVCILSYFSWNFDNVCIDNLKGQSVACVLTMYIYIYTIAIYRKNRWINVFFHLNRYKMLLQMFNVFI